MISNLQLKNLLGAETKNCTEDELSSIREILTSLASIEYKTYCNNNAATFINQLDISQKNVSKLAA